MKNNRNFSILMIVIFSALFLSARFFAFSLRPTLAEADLASQSPKDLFQEKCSACHNAPDPAITQYSALQWSRTVDRMLTKHGATDSITDDQANTIKTYLATFAPKGIGKRGPVQQDRTDVWPTSPIYSHVYRFSQTDSISAFRTISGHWAVADSSSGPALIATDSTSSTQPKIIATPTPALHENLQVEAEFKGRGATALNSRINADPKGVTFDTQDKNNYYLVAYDEVTQTVTLSQNISGVSMIIKNAPLPGEGTTLSSYSSDSQSPQWNKIKVMVIGTRVKVWVNYIKAIDANLSVPPGNGAVGLWAQSNTQVKSLVLDVYPNPPADIQPG